MYPKKVVMSRSAVRDVSKECDEFYENLQRDQSKTKAEKNALMINSFHNILLEKFDTCIGGFFYKRKSSYFDKNDKIKSAGTLMSGFLSKMGASSAKYDKRYFYLDTKAASLTYGKDKHAAINDPSYKAQLRDIESVTKSMVSMPVRDESGNITSFEQISIYDTNPNIDRGPEEAGHNVFEVKIANRMLTLYSDENILFEKFVMCLT